MRKSREGCEARAGQDAVIEYLETQARLGISIGKRFLTDLARIVAEGKAPCVRDESGAS